jgi:hypothetical protein
LARLQLSSPEAVTRFFYYFFIRPKAEMKEKLNPMDPQFGVCSGSEQQPAVMNRGSGDSRRT